MHGLLNYLILTKAGTSIRKCSFSFYSWNLLQVAVSQCLFVTKWFQKERWNLATLKEQRKSLQKSGMFYLVYWLTWFKQTDFKWALIDSSENFKRGVVGTYMDLSIHIYVYTYLHAVSVKFYTFSVFKMRHRKSPRPIPHVTWWINEAMQKQVKEQSES